MYEKFGLFIDGQWRSKAANSLEITDPATGEVIGRTPSAAVSDVEEAIASAEKGLKIWRDTQGKVTHFVSSMGTTGTIMGCSRFFKEQATPVKVIGVQPEEGAQIPGIRKWSPAYLPKIFDAKQVDEMIYVSQSEAEDMTRRLAREEGIFAGISSGGALAAALHVSTAVEDAVIVFIVCDRGDRYLSTGVFSA